MAFRCDDGIFLPVDSLMVFQGFRLFLDSHLTIGVNVGVIGCLSLFIGPVMSWQHVRAVPSFSLMSAGM